MFISCLYIVQFESFPCFQKHIAEHLNNFFTSIGKKLQKNIPSMKKHFSSFLKNPNYLSFFITPISRGSK